MKSEPDAYSIDDLERDGVEPWDGIRNYQARNFMRDDMSPGDLVLFYHSNADPPGVAGLCKVVETGLVDSLAFDPSSKYHDPKSDPDDPRWIMVSVGFVEKLPRFIPLSTLREDPDLEGMLVIQRGQRLSIQPVEPAHFRRVMKLGGSRKRFRIV